MKNVHLYMTSCMDDSYIKKLEKNIFRVFDFSTERFTDLENLIIEKSKKIKAERVDSERKKESVWVCERERKRKIKTNKLEKENNYS